jgi:hypothetical protein
MRIHSLLSPKCKLSRSSIEGDGVFAGQSFQPGELVAVWGGKIYTAAEVAQLAQLFPHFDMYPVTVCPGYYLASENLYEKDDAELFNHSCEANIGVRGQIILVARRPIEAGEELTFDYDTTEIDSKPFACRCGTPLCRGTIDGSGWKDPGFVARNRDYLSWHILDLLSRPISNSQQAERVPDTSASGLSSALRQQV